MLIEATKRKDLDFRALMEVYREGNEENGAVLYPDQPPERRIGLAEENFDHYLTEMFFPTPGARYLIWAEDGRYVSALRLERYEDGLLVTGLETRPDCRRRGYAARLLAATLDRVRETGGGPVYSHVRKTNTASLRTHDACGFTRFLDYARELDGTVTTRDCTLRAE